jgi:hypothetical protein
VTMTPAAPAPPPLTADEIAAIQARADRATPPPWSSRYPDYHVDGPPNVGVVLPREFRREEDRAFALAAREDVPRLLAEVARLRGALRLVAAGGSDYAELRRLARAALGE